MGVEAHAPCFGTLDGPPKPKLSPEAHGAAADAGGGPLAASELSVGGKSSCHSDRQKVCMKEALPPPHVDNASSIASEPPPAAAAPQPPSLLAAASAPPPPPSAVAATVPPSLPAAPPPPAAVDAA